MSRKKKAHHEEHVDETWLIPYADMLTLLLALFIVMFAMSKIDSEKAKKLSGEFNSIFSGSAAILPEGQTGTPAITNNQIEEKAMNGIKEELQEKIKMDGYSDKVKIELNEVGLSISIESIVLFNSGDDSVIDEVKPLLLEISRILKELDNKIKIVGHTDNIPIKNVKFRSNWDLSAMRAINVMNFIVDNGGVSSKKISIEAYGEQMPKYDNSTEEGRSKNRRVEILIIRKFATPSKVE